MADQATVSQANGNGRSVPINAPASAVVRNLAEFGNDAATLAELQAKLAAIDMKEAGGRAAIPAGALAASLALLLGAIPVGLFGVADLIADHFRIRPGWALLMTAGGAALIALIVGAVAGLRLGKSFEVFRRSRDELTRNLAWIKTVLANSGRMPTHNRR
jgi:hypothetical protein